MAPRSRSRAAQQAATAVPTVNIGDLPEGVLVRVLSFLELRERLGSVSLVSKRFAAAARSPDLLRQLDVGRWFDGSPLRAFTAFLVKHGQHLQRLALHCEATSEEKEANTDAAITACLSVAGAGGQLEHLTAIGGIRNTEWLAAMRSLRHLVVKSCPIRSPLHVSPAISALTALSSLTLEGSPIHFEWDTRRPTSIERMSLLWAGQDGWPWEPDDEDNKFPYQVAQLPRLASLVVQHCSYSAASLAALSHLANSLTCLDVVGSSIPSSLSTLMRLQRLGLWKVYTPEGDAAVVSAALSHIKQLTWLLIRTKDPVLPAALASLRNLQYCYLDLPVGLGVAALPLPAGPWLPSLRWLHCDAGSLVSSIAALQAATALEFLEVRVDRELDWGSPAAATLFDFLAIHPPLRCVRFDLCFSGPFDSSDFLVAHGKRLLRRRPGLEVISELNDDGEGYGTDLSSDDDEGYGDVSMFWLMRHQIL